MKSFSKSGVALGFFVLAACSAPPQLPEDPVIPPPFEQQDDQTYRVPETDETASQAYLEREIQRRGKLEERPPPPPQPKTEVRTVYLDNYNRAYEQPVRDPAAAFPWATAYGASVGAIIGSASYDAGEGAAIGAGIGFLFDLGRWASY